MKNTLLLLLICFIAVSCQNTATQDDNETTTIESDAQYGDRYFAVVWTWTTGNSKLVSENLTKINDEIKDLASKGTIDVAYYNTDSKYDKFEDFPNISFVIKSNSENSTARILDKMTMVTEDIATYTLFPVGQPYLGRKTELINEKGIKNSYAAVWSNTEKMEELTNQDELVGEQADAVMDLYENGIIENAYFDAPGVDTAVEKTDFLFHVNANTEEEARAVCDNLPFAKAGVAVYKIFPVGVLWMGN